MDTPEDIDEKKYIEKYLFLCGTCKYKKKGRCRNWNSDCVDGIVDDECSCEYWKPKKGVNSYE